MSPEAQAQSVLNRTRRGKFVTRVLMFRKNGTLFNEAVVRDDFSLSAARLYKSWNEVDERLRGLGVALEKVENLKSSLEAGEDMVLIRLP